MNVVSRLLAYLSTHSAVRWSRRLALLSSLVILVLVILTFPLAAGNENLNNLAIAALNLIGHGGWSDIAQDYYGLRAVLDRSQAYAPIGEMIPGLSDNWQTDHASTHPPTAFLLTAPVVFLPYAAAVSVWSVLMLLTIPASILLFGFSFKWAVFSLVLGLVWPPAYTALGHITPLWLLGVAIAYRTRRTSPAWSGVGLAVASFTKVFPALLLLLHVRTRRWRAVVAFALTWLVALVVLFVLHPDIFSQYLQANLAAAPFNIARPDNGALFAVLYRTAGPPGVALALLFLASLSAWLLQSRSSLWLFGCWLAVALLPVAWIYSLLPLLPILFFALRRRNWRSMALAGLALLLPYGAQTAPAAASVVALCLVSLGLALVDIANEEFVAGNGTPLH